MIQLNKNLYNFRINMSNKKQQKTFYIALADVLNNLSERSQDIIKKRFGIGYKKAMTLQGIGEDYEVSRERIRQIVNAGIKEIRNNKERKLFQLAEKEILGYVKDRDGIVVEKHLLNDLGNNDNYEKGSIRFFVEITDYLDFANFKKYPVLENAIIFNDFDIDYWHKIHSKVKDLLEEQQDTFDYNSLFEKISNEDKNIREVSLRNYLEASNKIDYNPFGKWGLIKWDDISPRGVREKAIIVLKENERPMHFSEITEAINDAGLNKGNRKSHKQTVHNELIKDKNFVLVGRGIYALESWGYEKGTVEDVIVNILNGSSKPLSANDIIKSVLKIRKVSPSTIKTNLNVVAEKRDGRYYLI